MDDSNGTVNGNLSSGKTLLDFFGRAGSSSSSHPSGASSSSSPRTRRKEAKAGVKSPDNVKLQTPSRASLERKASSNRDSYIQKESGRTLERSGFTKEDAVIVADSDSDSDVDSITPSTTNHGKNTQYPTSQNSRSGGPNTKTEPGPVSEVDALESLTDEKSPSNRNGVSSTTLDTTEKGERISKRPTRDRKRSDDRLETNSLLQGRLSPAPSSQIKTETPPVPGQLDGSRSSSGHVVERSQDDGGHHTRTEDEAATKPHDSPPDGVSSGVFGRREAQSSNKGAVLAQDISADRISHPNSSSNNYHMARTDDEWADDAEEGMGMDEPAEIDGDEVELVQDLGAFELREDTTGPGIVKGRVMDFDQDPHDREIIEIDSDADADAEEGLTQSGKPMALRGVSTALNPMSSGKKRKGGLGANASAGFPFATAPNTPSLTSKNVAQSHVRGAKKEQDAEEQRDEDELAEAESCPVCGKTFVALDDDAKRLHVNTCLDASWSRPEPCEPEIAEADRLPKQENADDVKPMASNNGSFVNVKKEQRPISSFCVPSIHPLLTAKAKKDAQEEMNAKLEEEASFIGPSGRQANAFSVLMSGHKEDEQWKVAEEDLRRDGKRVYGRRKAPFYKVLAGMPIAVDAFRYGSIPKVTSYFLSHAHSDHYTNLSASWKNGMIYASETTANLIKLMLGVSPEWVVGLKEDVPFEIPNSGGVTVTVIEANHCPGSSIFLFEGRQTVNAGDSDVKSPWVGSQRVFRYLHCGDFRACPLHVLHPAVAGKKLDTVYLDTTYLNPQYCFPPQPLVIDACADLARRTILGPKAYAAAVAAQKSASEAALGLGNGDSGDDEDDIKPYLAGATDMDVDERGRQLMANWLITDEEGMKEEGEETGGRPDRNKRTLIVMGTYSIGKERIVKGVARTLNCKIYCDPRKRAILYCQADPELHEMLTEDPIEAGIHLVPLQTIQLDRLQPYLHKLKDHFGRVLAFRPTGWTYSPPAGTDMLPDVNTVIRRDQKRTFTSAYLRPMRGSSRQFMMFGVPYSEHSSFFELTCFALSVPGDPKMIATVNVGNEKRFEKWQSEKNKRGRAGLPAVIEYRHETFVSCYTD